MLKSCGVLLYLINENLTYLLKKTLTLLFILSTLFVSAQKSAVPAENNEEAAQTEEMECLIVGVWVAEGASFKDRVEYKQNGTYIEYSENGNKYYNWEIYTETTKSGLTISKLIVQGNNHNFSYSINAIGEERMVLVYMTGGHLSRNPYTRQ